VVGDGWTFFQNSSPTTKFLGNAIDVDTHGNTHICFSDNGDHIHYINPCTRGNNIIIGTRWIEHFGNLQFKNLTNGYTCNIEFKKGGIFSGPQYNIAGFIFDPTGIKCIELEGRWDQYLNAKWLVDSLNRKTGEIVQIWKIAENSFIENDQYGFSKFAATLNCFDDEMDAVLLPTDSRRRLDRMYLEKGDSDSATKWKRIMEERQRADRKTRKDLWVPTWFHEEKVATMASECASASASASAPAPASSSSSSSAASSSHGDVDPTKIWTYKGTFWPERDGRAKCLAESAYTGPSSVAKIVSGLACDFTSYEPKSATTTDTTLTDTDGSDDNNPSPDS